MPQKTLLLHSLVHRGVSKKIPKFQNEVIDLGTLDFFKILEVSMAFHMVYL